MKLETKHLQWYLSYKLRYKWKNVIWYMNDLHHNPDIGIDGLPLDEIIPILRSFSDLTKEIEVNGERFIPADELLKNEYKLHFQENIGKYSIIDYEVCHNYIDIYCKYNAGTKIRINFTEIERNSFFIIQKLLEWHFDVYGLIANGLAVDINSL